MDTFSIDLAGEADLPPMTVPLLLRATKRGPRKNRYLGSRSQSRGGPVRNVHDRQLTIEDPRPIVSRI